MSWTAPRTWVAGEIVTAAEMNTHIRDNTLATNPVPSTTPPGSPTVGTRWIYDGTNYYWEFLYDSRDVTYPWKCIGGGPLATFSSTNQNTNGGGAALTFLDIAITVPRTGIYVATFTNTASATPNAGTPFIWQTALYDNTASVTLSNANIWDGLQGGSAATMGATGSGIWTGALTSGHSIIQKASVVNWDYVSAYRGITLMPVRVA